MTWKIIRDANNEIIRYELNERIFIRRIYTTVYNVSKYYHYLIVDGKCVDCNEDGVTTVKMLKEKGEIRYESFKKRNNIHL